MIPIMEEAVMQEEWLSLKEAASYLRVRGSTLRHWITRGKIRGYRLGDEKKGLWRIRTSDLDKYIRTGKTQL